jgi:hypothetical protein
LMLNDAGSCLRLKYRALHASPYAFGTLPANEANHRKRSEVLLSPTTLHPNSWEMAWRYYVAASAVSRDAVAAREIAYWRAEYKANASRRMRVERN